MARHARYRVPFRRRRQGLTDYRYRLAQLKSHKPRAVVRCSNARTQVQLVEFHLEGDKVLASATADQLRQLGWDQGLGNLPAAYLTGLLAGKRAKAAGIETAVLDLGLATHVPGNKRYAALQGLLDAGLELPHSESVLPAPERLEGRHLSNPEKAGLALTKVKQAIEKM